MRSNKKKAILTVFFLAIFFFGFGCGGQIEAGLTAPDFMLSDLSGQMISLRQHRGSVVLLDFWATWCRPCRMSIPELVKLQEKHKKRGLVILGVSLDDPGQATDKYLRAFKGKAGINYTILRYNKKLIQDYFGHETPAIPTMFVIDREGKIREKHVGFRPGAIEKSLVRVFE